MSKVYHGAFARRTDPGTSHKAAERGHLTAACLVYEALCDNPNGLTANEISDITGVKYRTVSPRIKPFRDRGIVIGTGRERENQEVIKVVVPGLSPGDIKQMLKESRSQRVIIDELKSSTVDAQSFHESHRPVTFAEIVGQQKAISIFRRTESNGIHAWVFHGKPGTGKTTLALVVARFLRADRVTPVDAATHGGVDDMRELTESYAFRFTGVHVVIIDEAHMLSQAAWKALLAIVEKPPKGLYIIFVTTEIGKVPPTFESQRCVSIHLEDVGQNDMIDHLKKVCKKERWTTPSEVLGVCARQSHGAPRRAMTLLSICSHFTTRDEALEAIGIADDKDPSEIPYRLARLLKESSEWADFQSLLKNAEAYPETIRRVIREYYKTVLLNEKNNKRLLDYAAKVLQNFEEPVDMESLVLALYLIVRGE